MVEVAIAALGEYLRREIALERAHGAQTSSFQETTRELRIAIETENVTRIVEHAQPFAAMEASPREIAYELWLCAAEHHGCQDLLVLIPRFVPDCDVDMLRLCLATGDWGKVLDELVVHGEPGLRVHCRRVLAAWGT
jgi:hypothetical protein